MEEYELNCEIAESKSQKLKDEVSKAVYLTKFTAVIAKKILEVSGKYHVSIDDLFEVLNEWIVKIEDGGKTNEKN